VVPDKGQLAADRDWDLIGERVTARARSFR